jgi:hypothetical protein
MMILGGSRSFFHKKTKEGVDAEDFKMNERTRLFISEHALLRVGVFVTRCFDKIDSLDNVKRFATYSSPLDTF